MNTKKPQNKKIIFVTRMSKQKLHHFTESNILLISFFFGIHQFLETVFFLQYRIWELEEFHFGCAIVFSVCIPVAAGD